MSEKSEPKSRETKSGLFLIILGVALLTGQLFDWGSVALLIPAGLGLFFMSWGILTRNGGLMIPGGILSGIGLGIIITDGPLGHLALVNNHEDAWIMGSFALGWVSIVLATALFSCKTMVWPLIPAAIMALIATSLVVGGSLQTALSFAGRSWPVILIAIGLWTLIDQRRRHEVKKADLFD